MRKVEASTRSKRLEYAIRDVAIIADEIEKKEGVKVIRLNIGDPTYYDFDVPRHIKEEMCKAVQEGKNHYSPSSGVLELKQAIVSREKRDNNISITEEDVFVTNGLSEAILAIYASAFNPGEKVLVPSPTYPPYISAAKFFDVVPVEYPTDEEIDWLPDVDKLRKQIDEKVKALVIINPNNPTGAVYPPSIVKELIDIAGEYNLFVISDEIYDRIVFEGDKAPNAASLSNDVPILVLNGFSKVYLATGWRVGYIYRFDRENVLEDVWNAILKFLLTRISGVAPAQYALAKALTSSHDFLKQYINELKKRRDYSYKRLNEIPNISAKIPKGALYIFPKIEIKKYENKDFQFVIDLLKEEKVLIVHGSGFGSMGVNHFRAVFLPPIEIQEEAYNRLENFVKRNI